jgi:magnesium transporter
VIVDCAAYVDGVRATATLPLEDVPDWVGRPDAFVWVGLRVPSLEDLRTTLQACLTDADLAGEVLAPHDRPVLSTEDEVTTLVLRTARYNSSLAEVSLGELSVMVGDGFVVTVRHGHASPLSQLRAELERDPQRLAQGPQAVLAAVVEQVVDDYRPALDGLERAAIEIEREVFAESRQRPAKRIYALKREVRELLVALDSLHHPLSRLTRGRREGWSDEVVEELHEAAEELGRAVARTSTLSDLLTSALDANLAQVSVQQNEDMRRISAWVAIAAVPTMIAGIYGMNFEHMPELGWRAGYPLVLVLMAGACTALYRTFRRSGWL